MIIETKEEFKRFLDAYKDNSVILIPILSDNKRNALNNKLCLLFIKILNKPEYYILPFTHSETLNLDEKILDHILLLDNKKYVLDKKEFLKIYNAKNLIDVNLVFYLNTNVPAEISQKYSKAELSFISKSITMDNIYDIVPILKIKERLVDCANSIEFVINSNKESELQESFEFLNNTTIESLYEIEKNGIYVNTEKLLKYHPNYLLHVDDNNLVYTDYNIYTSTGRPSNRFGNLNFAALNKDNGERAFIESRFGKRGVLFYFDYEAYHLNLVADLVGYTFPPNISIHEYLGRQYFGKKSLTESEYDESKVVSFNILYGGIHETIAKAIPFFGKTQEFITKMWHDYQNDGYIKTKVSKKKIYPENLDSMSSNKLFNYYLQNYETERNILIINKLNNLLSDHSTKLIMYLYDGFLFDYCLDDDKKLYKQIKDMLRESDKFKTKQYVGKNFDKMKKIE
jgi:hypothetical protein